MPAFLRQILLLLLLGVFCFTGFSPALAAEKSTAQKKAEYRAKVRAEAKEKAMQAARESVMGVTPAMVQNAITGGIEFLKSSQGKSGGWKEEDIHIGGISSLCTLALLNAGVPADDPSMVRALNFLREIDPTTGPIESNYVCALQTMVFCLADPQKDAGLIRRNVHWLMKTQKTQGSKPGAWGYPYGDGDPSNSQFALLALYEADQIGLTILPEVWQRASGYWEKTQNMDGSWSYYYLPPNVEHTPLGSGSMTCAGIVSLLISAEKSKMLDAAIEDDVFIPCQRQTNKLTKRLNQACGWMANHFSVARNPGNKDWLLYYLYGLERMGRMTEQRFIGGHDWYREGTAHLLRMAKTVATEDRLLVFWEGTTASERIQPIATSLALLFLSKGRYPVMMTKAQFTTESEDWNWHRHDISHLARYVEKQWKKHMTTQSVDLNESSVEDLLLSPVLFISGKDSPCPKDTVKRQELGRKLRDYIDRGGFIVAEGVCPGGTFDAGMKTLLKEIFPEEEHHFYPMPPEHPIWTAEVAIPSDYVRPVYCLDYGCRTCMLFMPGQPKDPKKPTPSLSCLWELAPEMRPETIHSMKVKREIKAGLDLGLNILAYVTERKLKGKEESFASSTELMGDEILNDGEKEGGSIRGKLAVANLRHGGGCDAAPKALRNLLMRTAPEIGITSGVLDDSITLTSPRLFEFPVVFMQGRYAFRFTPAERQRLHLWLERGGLLFVNSICGSEAFDAAFRKELEEIFEGSEVKLEEIPLGDVLYSRELGGFDLTKIQTRPERNAPPQPLRLWGLRVNGRWAVVYSPLDLSCALEEHPSAGCRGYTPEDAAKIGVNVILYSMQ